MTRSAFEPTPGERRNGWTEPALNEYILQRERAALIRVFGDPADKGKKRPLKIMRKFSPLRWFRGKQK